MKTKETILPEGFTINPSLTGKYDKEPYFIAKAEKAKEILKKHPVPEHVLYRNK